MSRPASDPTGTEHSVDEDKIADLVKEYMNQWETGNPPSRVELLAKHPDLAAALAPYLDGLDAIYGAGLTKRTILPDDGAMPLGQDGSFPQPLGDFRIVREIGRGGMGSVYEAMQLSLGRRVALKILPLAAALDERNLKRFKTEAQAAALLHHSNIVPVYAVGCERGVHYYAMQLIEGQSLAEIIRHLQPRNGRHDATSGDPLRWLIGSLSLTASHPARTNGKSDTVSPPSANGSHVLVETKSPGPVGFAAELSTMHDASKKGFYRTATRLIRDAALALEHAHKSGIIHRDIKPGNLLVDRTGNIWITDFGLAQFHEEIGPTRTGDLLGTLQYMSPEQASGQRVVLDARTDVYSLGATLYELLALRPMFDGQNRQAVLRQISSEEPKLLRSVDRNIPVELELITLKATAKAPNERYATAQDLADDLDSYLSDRPIRAKRPTIVESARKWSRRHPSIVGSAVAMLALVAIGLAIHTSRLAVEQSRTKAALAQEKDRAEEAEKGFRQAREAVDLLVQVAEEELRNQPPLANVRRRLLETALTYYEDLLEEDSPTAKTARPSLTAAKSRVRKILADLATIQGAHRISLLRDSAVQLELGLSDEQKARVMEVASQRPRNVRPTRGSRPGVSAAPATSPSNGNQDARRQRFVDWLRKQENELTAILTPAQSVRLDQVILQLEGPHAFTEPAVVERLKLTKMQRDWATRVENDAVGAMFSDLRAGRSVDADRVRDISQKATERCLKMLRDEQKTIWNSLVGEPLKYEPKLHLPPTSGAGFPWPPAKTAPPPTSSQIDD